jgi:nucleoside-diphosphate-sugar epimerase
MSDSLAKPALVMGASGAFGGAVAAELIARGVPLRLLARSPALLARRFPSSALVTIIPGDAQEPAQVARAAEGCGLVVAGVNYPYHQWVPFLHTATQNALHAARLANARLLFPGNVYGLGRGGETPLDEAAPERPITRKGHFRVRLEAMLRAACEPNESGLPPLRVLIVRAGDYFGPSARNRLVDGLFGRAARGAALQMFGRPEARHEFLYLPDLARAALDLCALEAALPDFALVHVGNGLGLTLGEMGAAIAGAAGRPDLKLRFMPWWLVSAFGLIDPAAREFREMRYLYDETLLLDNALLGRLLPKFRFTPLDEALARTVESWRA